MDPQFETSTFWQSYLLQITNQNKIFVWMSDTTQCFWVPKNAKLQLNRAEHIYLTMKNKLVYIKIQPKGNIYLLFGILI